MLKRVVPYNEDLAKAFAGISWRYLNETYKDYNVVERIVIQKAKTMGINEECVRTFTESVLRHLGQLKLKYSDNIPGS